jgi:DnaK suppressor protein
MAIELPSNYELNEKDEYMNEYQLEYFRQKLLSWKQELLEESTETLDHLKEENWNEPDEADRATVETDASLELRTRDRYRKLINKIDKTVRRIEEDEYGFCEVSGDPIGLKRLDARPIATMTIESQEEHEESERRSKFG